MNEECSSRDMYPSYYQVKEKVLFFLNWFNEWKSMKMNLESVTVNLDVNIARCLQKRIYSFSFIYTNTNISFKDVSLSQ